MFFEMLTGRRLFAGETVGRAGISARAGGGCGGASAGLESAAARARSPLSRQTAQAPLAGDWRRARRDRNHSGGAGVTYRRQSVGRGTAAPVAARPALDRRRGRRQHADRRRRLAPPAGGRATSDRQVSGNDIRESAADHHRATQPGDSPDGTHIVFGTSGGVFLRSLAQQDVIIIQGSETTQLGSSPGFRQTASPSPSGLRTGRSSDWDCPRRGRDPLSRAEKPSRVELGARWCRIRRAATDSAHRRKWQQPRSARRGQARRAPR